MRIFRAEKHVQVVQS